MVLDWNNEWTFKNRKKNILTHSIHKYPAIYLPEVAKKIIEMYSNENDVVLDIFSGSGTGILEALSCRRYGIGIELNPLAHFISINKIYDFDIKSLENSVEDLFNCINMDIVYEIISFENIEFWFDKETIKSISIYLSYIKKYDNKIRDFFKICLSEIIRNISFCNHGGFKMHKDKKKIDTSKYDLIMFLDVIKPVILRNLEMYKNYNFFLKSNGLQEYARKSKIYHHDTTVKHDDILDESVDLIITSPPYGDSKTTVAYGQFSRLSLQILDIKHCSGTKITQLDNDLLGGSVKFIEYDGCIKNSLTLQNIQELFLLRIKTAINEKEKKRSISRLKDIISFYRDLDKAIYNASKYLKTGKYFVLITASRIVHSVKLHTDQIISEMASLHGFKIKNIHYRDIVNKRMPSKVSSTNIVGKTSPTMTEETIIVLQKN